MTRLKTFHPQSTLEKSTELKIQDNSKGSNPRPQARLANCGWLGGSGRGAWARRSITSDTSQEGTELFTGSHLLQGPASPSPRPQQHPFPTPPFIRSLSAAQRGSQKVHPGWNLKPEILRRRGWGKWCRHQF